MWTLLLAAGAAAGAVDPELPSERLPGLYLRCLEEFEAYAESVWQDADAPPGSGYFGDGASGGNGGIRGTCGIALAYATLNRARRGTEPERKWRAARLEAALRYAAETHVTGPATCVDGKQWGHGWQTSLWTGSLGFAAALAEGDLAPEVVLACMRVVADEATYRAGIPPASGYVGDSKAEENAWNSNVLALAAAWMPEHESAGKWLEAAKRYLANTYTVPDSQSDPMASWLTTTTLYPSFTCENHGFFHPSYQQVSGMSMGDAYAMARAVRPETGAELKQFAEHNVLPTWRCLERVLLDSGELAYPSGLDWSLHGYGQLPYYAYLAQHFGDPTARWAEGMLAQHIAYRQEVNGDGRFTGEGVPSGFYTEAVKARRVALAWWHHRLADRPRGYRRSPQAFVTHMPDVGLVLQRGPLGFFSLSYGKRTMALVVPESATRPDEPYVVTPRYPSLIAPGAFGPATGAELLSLDVDETGFRAELLVRFGDIETRRVAILSTCDALAIIEAPQPLVRVSTAPPAFPVGIENHALTGGERRLHLSDGEHTVGAMSGERLESDDGWLSLPYRLGYVAGPGGQIVYQTADGYNRRGAAEDTLHFVPEDPFAPRYVIVFPSGDRRALAGATASVAWRADGGELSLEFRAPVTGDHTLRLHVP